MRLLLVLALAAGVQPARAAVYLVRHAERKSLEQEDSLLSPAGHARAKRLAEVLVNVPLKAVYCTEYARTCQTAAPTARSKKLETTVSPTDKEEALSAALKKLADDEDVLVVGHTDTLPGLLKSLGVAVPIEIAKTDYGNLFVVTPRPGKKPLLQRLRY